MLRHRSKTSQKSSSKNSKEVSEPSISRKCTNRTTEPNTQRRQPALAEVVRLYNRATGHAQLTRHSIFSYLSGKTKTGDTSVTSSILQCPACKSWQRPDHFRGRAQSTGIFPGGRGESEDVCPESRGTGIHPGDICARRKLRRASPTGGFSLPEQRHYARGRQDLAHAQSGLPAAFARQLRHPHETRPGIVPAASIQVDDPYRSLFIRPGTSPPYHYQVFQIKNRQASLQRKSNRAFHAPTTRRYDRPPC